MMDQTLQRWVVAGVGMIMTKVTWQREVSSLYLEM
jgi:hypothetical protein